MPLDALRDPLLFLALAVPLAVLLDHLGVFAALAGARPRRAPAAVAVAARHRRDGGVQPRRRRRPADPVVHPHRPTPRLDPVVLAFQPALLACLASSPAAGVQPDQPDRRRAARPRRRRLPRPPRADDRRRVHRRMVRLCRWARSVRRLAAATCRRPSDDTVDDGRAAPRPADHRLRARRLHRRQRARRPRLDRRCDRRGVGDRAHAGTCRGARSRSGRCSWPRPLAVLVAGALPHLHIDRLLDAGGIAGRLRAFGFGAIGSDATNNLPAVLAGSASLHDGTGVGAARRHQRRPDPGDHRLAQRPAVARHRPAVRRQVDARQLLGGRRARRPRGPAARERDWVVLLG